MAAALLHCVGKPDGDEILRLYAVIALAFGDEKTQVDRGEVDLQHPERHLDGKDVSLAFPHLHRFRRNAARAYDQAAPDVDKRSQHMIGKGANLEGDFQGHAPFAVS